MKWTWYFHGFYLVFLFDLVFMAFITFARVLLGFYQVFFTDFFVVDGHVLRFPSTKSNPMMNQAYARVYLVLLGFTE